MNYVLIFIGFLVTNIGIFKDYKTQDKNKRRISWVLWIFAMATGVITICMQHTAAVNAQSEKSVAKLRSDSLRTATDSILKLHNRIDSLERSVSVIDAEIRRISDSLNSQKELLQNDNYKLSRQLTTTALTLTKNVTGSTEPPYIDIANLDDKRLIWRIYNDDDYSIYQLQIIVYDYDRLLTCKQFQEQRRLVIDRGCKDSCISVIHVDELWIGQKEISPLYNFSKPYGRLLFSFQSRSSSYFQEFVYVLKQGYIMHKSRIIKFDNHDKIDKTYARIISSKGSNLQVDFDREFPHTPDKIVYTNMK